MKKYQLLLISFCCILLIGCNEKESNNSKSHSTPIKVIRTTSNLSSNIDKALQEAELTYKKIANFRDALFKDGLYQGQSILCSIHRLVNLKSENREVIKYFDKEAKKIFNKSTFISYNDYLVPQKFLKPRKLQKPQNKYIHILTIPSSKQYTNLKLDTYFLDNANKLVPRSGNGNKEQICEDYYLKPIPNSNQAKKIEITNFARIIVTSLRRTKMHEERLPILETQLSTILSFESTLKKMKKDLAFDMLDPLNTEAKIKEYDNFFNKSLQSLSEFKKDLSF